MAAGETRADTAQKYSLRPVNKSIEFHDDFVDGGSGGGLFLRRSKRKTIGIAIAAGIPAKNGDNDQDDDDIWPCEIEEACKWHRISPNENKISQGSGRRKSRTLDVRNLIRRRKATVFTLSAQVCRDRQCSSYPSHEEHKQWRDCLIS